MTAELRETLIGAFWFLKPTALLVAREGNEPGDLLELVDELVFTPGYRALLSETGNVFDLFGEGRNGSPPWLYSTYNLLVVTAYQTPYLLEPSLSWQRPDGQTGSEKADSLAKQLEGKPRPRYLVRCVKSLTGREPDGEWRFHRRWIIYDMTGINFDNTGPA